MVLYINTESYGLAAHGENGKFVIGNKYLPGSEESDCSLTDIPDKVTSIFIIITILLLCTAIIVILVIKIIHDINMNNIESCTNTQSSYQVCLLSSTLNINVEKYSTGSVSRTPSKHCHWENFQASLCKKMEKPTHWRLGLGGSLSTLDTAEK